MLHARKATEALRSAYFERDAGWLNCVVQCISRAGAALAIVGAPVFGALPAERELERVPVAPERFEKMGEGHYFVDFGRDAFGWLELDLKSVAEGGKVEIRLGEMAAGDAVMPGAAGSSIRFVDRAVDLEPGVLEYRVPMPADKRNTSGPAIRMPAAMGVVMPFRYAEIIHGPAGLEGTMIRQVAVRYPFDENAGSFESSDGALNAVWALCKYSIEATNFTGIYVDGDRERTPYEADAYIDELGDYCLDRDYAPARRTEEYLMAHPTWPTEWKQQAILMAWADWMQTGDTDYLAAHYDELKTQKLLLEREGSDGLVDTKGMRDIVDWPAGERDGFEMEPVNTVVNAFHYRTLVEMGEIAAVLGKGSDAADFRQRGARVKEAFNARLFDERTGRYVDGEGSGHASLHANMFALAFGLVPAERERSVADFVKARGMACSVYGAQYLLEGLYQAGEADAALRLMTGQGKRSWENMLRSGATMTTEAWDVSFKPNEDWNHAWGAAPANIIPRYLLGVRPLAAGCGRMLIAPQPGSLAEASGRVPTNRGAITVKMENEAGRAFSLSVEIPAGVSARVVLPGMGSGSRVVTVDGREMEGMAEEGGVVVDPVGAGTHLLERGR